MALGGGAAEGIQIPVEGDSSGLNQALDGAIGKLNDFRGAVAVAGGALAGMAAKGLAEAVSAAADFEGAMADVEKVTTPEVAEEMRGEIMSMAEEIPMAQEELATLATQAGRMGAEGTDEVAEFTRVAASMGEATALSADEAGTALGKLSSALDEPLQEAGKLGDAINEVSNNFATDSQEIVDAAQRSGQALGELGLQSDEIIGLAGAFNEVSPTSRIAASRMQQVSEAMMDPSNVEFFADAIGVSADKFREMREEAPQETMMELMDAVDEGKVSYDELSTQLTDSTARAFRDTSGAADEMRRAMETSGKAMEEGGSLANELAVETDTAAGQWELLKNRARNLAIQIGDNLLPYIRDILEVITRGISRFEAINDATDGWAGTIGLLVGLVGGLVAAGGALVSMMGGLGAITGAVTAGFTGIASAAAAVSAPMLALIGIVALLAQAFRTDFAGIRTAVEDVVAVFMERLQPAIDWLQTDGVPIAHAIKDALVQFAEDVEPYLTPLVDLIADGLIWAINKLFDVLEAVIPPAIAFLSDLASGTDESVGSAADTFQDLKTTVEEAVARIREVLAPLIQWLTDRWTEFDEAVLQEARKTWDELADAVDAFTTRSREVLTPLFEWLDQKFQWLQEILVQYFQGLYEDLVAVWRGLTNVLRTLWETFGDEIITYVRFWIDLVTGIFSTFWDGLLALWSAQLQLLRGDWREALNTIVTFLTDTFNGIISFVTEWGGRFITWLSGLVNRVIEWFRSLYQRLIGGSIIPEMFNSIIEAARSFGQSIIDWLTGLVEWFIGKIQNLYQQTVELFRTVFTTVVQAARTFAGKIRAWRVSLVEWWLGKVQDLLDQTVAFYEDLFTTVLQTAREFGGLLIDWLTGLIDRFLSWIDSWTSDVLTAAEGLWDDILSAARTFGSDLLSWLDGVVSDFISAVESFASDAVGKFETLADDLLDAITDLDLYQAGKDLVSDLASGIRNKIPSAKGAARKLANGVDRLMPGSDAEEGPLSDITESGPAIPLTIAEGMTDELRDVQRAAEEVAAEARPELTADVPDLGAAVAQPSTSTTTIDEGDEVQIEVNIEGDADRHEVERGLSRALESYNINR